MLRKIIFKDTEKQTELTLPVTPESFQAQSGLKIETIHIHQLGDVNLAGYTTLANLSVSCMFPAQNYSFVYGSFQEPYSYIEQFQTWIINKTVLRFVVSDTPINIMILVESIEYGERDGTNDVYAEIRFREYRELKAIETEQQSGNHQRTASETGMQTASQYTVKQGDNLWNISRKFYGDPQLCYKLAAYNNIKNANLIFPNQILNIPPKEQLT